VGFWTQPTRSHIQCLQGILSAAAVSAISVDPAEQSCWQGSQSLGPQPLSSLPSSGSRSRHAARVIKLICHKWRHLSPRAVGSSRSDCPAAG
jgi:hypothetical protein